MKNLTPEHLRCPAAYCPSVHELDDGKSLLIVGKRATMAAAIEHIPVGEDEFPVIIDKALLDDVPRGWRDIASAPTDGRPILVHDGRVSIQIVEWDASRTDGLNWSDRAGSFFHEDEFTHWMPLPPAPASPRKPQNDTR